MAVAGRRKKRTSGEIFIDELRKQSGDGQPLISNSSLRQALNWDDEKYNRTKSDLFKERLIIVGRGRGGSVGLADAPGGKTSEALSLFISYSHQDEKIKDDLLKHLAPLKRLNLIEEWHDRKIEPGDKWADVISDQLDNADIILIIVSIDFINSKYCYDIEMETALDRATSNEAVLVPVIARDCLWKTTHFAHLQALPTDGKAITSWADRDEAMRIVADGVHVVAERLIAKR